MYNTLFIISLIFNVNFFIFSILLFYLRQGNKLANKVLASILLLLSIVNTLLILYSHPRFYSIFPHLIQVHLPVIYLLPVMLYFYFQSALNSNFKFQRKQTLHFIPCLVITLWLTPFLFQPATAKINWVKEGVFEQQYYLPLILFVQLVFYYTVMLKKYLKIKISKRNFIDKKMIGWLRDLLIIALLILIAMLTSVFIFPSKLHLLVYIPIISSVLFYALVYRVITSPEIFIKFEHTKILIDKPLKNKPIGIKADVIIDIKNKLETSMKDKDIFLSTEMILPNLALRLRVPAHQLSRVIRQEYKQTYKDFINTIRIEEAKLKLTDHKFDNITLEAIGQSVGFMSRNAFLSAFKKHTGYTPSNYKNNKTKQINLEGVNKKLVLCKEKL